MLLVDTNVLLDVLLDDPAWVEWSLHQLRSQAQVQALCINAVIYAELAPAFQSPEKLDAALEGMQIEMIALPKAALFLAGQAFVRYRRLGGIKSGVLADFFIGAHAAVLQCPVLTRDTRRYASYFPTVKLIAPARP